MATIDFSNRSCKGSDIEGVYETVVFCNLQYCRALKHVVTIGFSNISCNNQTTKVYMRRCCYAALQCSEACGGRGEDVGQALATTTAQEGEVQGRAPQGRT